MRDREEVINGLEHCSIGACAGKECPYYHDVMKDATTGCDCTTELVRDAIALLKEQEAVEPILKRQGRNKYYNYYVCRCCNEELFYQQNYCSECGRPVKWDA